MYFTYTVSTFYDLNFQITCFDGLFLIHLIFLQIQNKNACIKFICRKKIIIFTQSVLLHMSELIPLHIYK